MGRESQKAGADFEGQVEELLKQHDLNYIRNYEARTVTGNRKIDFVVLTKIGRVFIETKYRSAKVDIAAYRSAAEGLFIVMYEYKQLYPGDHLLAVVNDIKILNPGKQNYVSLLASIGVEVAAFKEGKPDALLLRKIQEMKKAS